MPRTATRRHYLMVPPTYFDVEYAINPWMDPRKPTSPELALAQWEWLRDLYSDLGHRVDLLRPMPGLPDMVFAGSGATVIDGRVLVSRFRHTQRCAESAALTGWFRTHGYRPVRQARWVNEGAGDYLLAGSRVLAGSGFRTNTRAHREFQEYFGLPVTGLTLADPRYYHLDTALTVLDRDTVMYYPAAFSEASQAALAKLYPDAITATSDDAAAFGLNAVSDGEHVVLPEAAAGLMARLRERGFTPIAADVSELGKAGGGVRCCTLELHRYRVVT